MRPFLAALAYVCSLSAAVGAFVWWMPYTGYAPNETVSVVAIADIATPAVEAKLHPPAVSPMLFETYLGDLVTPQYRALGEPKPRPTPQILLAEASKSLGKGPREFGPRRSLWCADAVNKWLQRIGLKGTGSALAASFVRWGSPAKPGPGVIAVKSRHGGNHVVVIKAVQGKTVIAISPNSRGKVREMRYSVRQFYAFRLPT